MPVVDLSLSALALTVALALRPWRAWPESGPPWPWILCAAAMPPLWAADRLAGAPLPVTLSGACLLVLMAGWPTAVLALPAVAGVAALMGGLPAADALHRAVWLGLVPSTLALALGAAIRHGLPRHLFVYILGRGFLATTVALAATAAIEMALAPPAAAGLDRGDLWLARLLGASGEAFITGMWVAIFVAFRPHWLATYTDRLYLPGDGRRH